MPYSDRDRLNPAGKDEPPRQVSALDVIRDGLETLKYLGGFAAAALLYIDSQYEVIPVTAQIRRWGVVAAILAVVAGLGAHQSARRLREPSVGWGFFWFAVIDLVALMALVSVRTPLPAQATAAVIPILYALLFVLIGGSLGGFLL